MKVDLVGMVENMSYFVCPHCQHEMMYSSRGGVEKPPPQFGVPFLGNVQLTPPSAKPEDTGKPAVLREKRRSKGSPSTPSPAR